MVLHPVGGNFEHLLAISDMGIIAHSIAILAIPLMAYGYWGIMNQLGSAVFLSRIGFSFMCFGLVAVMIAATLNGLVLMLLVKSYAGSSDAVIEGIRPIFRFNHYFNLANDYIYMAAVGLSTLFWSVAILKTRQLPVWLAYAGIFMVLSAFLTLLSGFVFTDVRGFSLFIFGTAAWTVLMGLFLIRKSGREATAV